MASAPEAVRSSSAIRMAHTFFFMWILLSCPFFLVRPTAYKWGIDFFFSFKYTVSIQMTCTQPFRFPHYTVSSGLRIKAVFKFCFEIVNRIPYSR